MTGMPTIEYLDQHVVYENPKPHVHISANIATITRSAPIARVPLT
jgi:hypothetical protein